MAGPWEGPDPVFGGGDPSGPVRQGPLPDPESSDKCVATLES